MAKLTIKLLKNLGKHILVIRWKMFPFIPHISQSFLCVDGDESWLLQQHGERELG